MTSSFKAALMSFGLVGSACLMHFYFKIKKNQIESEKMRNDDLFRDATRPQYQNFGLNWGSRADQMIMDELDSGDVFFVKYDCSKCTSFSCTPSCS